MENNHAPGAGYSALLPPTLKLTITDLGLRRGATFEQVERRNSRKDSGVFLC